MRMKRQHQLHQDSSNQNREPTGQHTSGNPQENPAEIDGEMVKGAQEMMVEPNEAWFWSLADVHLLDFYCIHHQLYYL